MRRRFRVRVDGIATTARFARIRAFVHSELPGHRVRVDGRLITSVPQLIGTAAPLGVPIAHTLEIEVPTSEPEGVLAHDIVWQAEVVR